MPTDLKDFMEAPSASCSVEERHQGAALDVGMSPLFGRENYQPKPHYARQQEKPEHRVMAYMKASGFTAREIADAMGVSATTVQEILRQPWINQLTVEIAHARGIDKALAMIDSLALPAVEALGQVVKDPDASNRDRINAADKILCRKYGNPNQPMTFGKAVDPRTLSDEDLARIAAGGSTRTATAPDGTCGV